MGVSATSGCSETMVPSVWFLCNLDMNLSKLLEIVKAWEPGVLQSMGLQRVGRDLATE